MPAPTIAVTCAASDQGGESVAGGIYTAKLDQTEIYDGFVVPEQVTATADADGLVILNLWPNALGVNGSSYRITARNPDTGKKFFDASVVVPNNPCNLYQIIQNAPFPNVDSAQQALIDVQALVTIANQDVAATNADAQQTAADRLQTAAYRLQTGEDRTAARDSAANALTSENAASGQADLAVNAAATTQTLRDSIIATQGAIGYLPPVTYAAGLSMTLPAQTVSYMGLAYAPLLSMLPFVTNGTFEAAKFRLIQGVSGADLATPDGAALVGGVNPIYVLKNHRLPGDSDSAVINKALRKIELDALPGARLQFECGRSYTYTNTHSLGYINDLDIDLNGALLKRADSSVTKTTLAATLDTTGVAGRTMVLTSIPANWQVTDTVAAVVGTGNDGASNPRRITAINRGTNTVTLQYQLDGYTGASSYPPGTVIAKSFNCFCGRPSVTDSLTLLTQGANKRIRIHGGTIDGNEANQVSNSWRIGSEIVLHSEGGAVYDMKIQNTAAECIVGHGMTISGNTFLDLAGSALHTSVNDVLVDVATPTIFTGNVVRRTNLKGQIASGHAEGAITFSWGPGHLIISDNLFDGGNEPLLGNFGVSTGANPSRLLIVSGNICKGYTRIFAAVQAATYGVTITGNSFHDCGDNTTLTSTLYNRLNRIAGNSISGNTILPEQAQLVAQRFGPVVVETIGGAGPAIATNPNNRLWVKQTASGVPAANLATANVVLESGENNLLTFATVATKYAGIEFRVAGSPNAVFGYLTSDYASNSMLIGPNNALADLILKSGNHVNHLKMKGNGSTVFMRRDQSVYFGDPDTDGSWSLDCSGTDFKFFRRVAGSWVVKQTILG